MEPWGSPWLHVLPELKTLYMYPLFWKLIQKKAPLWVDHKMHNAIELPGFLWPSPRASAGLVGFFFRGMAQFLKPGELQVFQGPKVNRGYNITMNSAGCLVLAKLFVTSIFEKQNQS